MPKHFYNLRWILVYVVRPQSILQAETHCFSKPMSAAAGPQNDDVSLLLFVPECMKQRSIHISIWELKCSVKINSNNHVFCCVIPLLKKSLCVNRR